MVVNSPRRCFTEERKEEHGMGRRASKLVEGFSLDTFQLRPAWLVSFGQKGDLTL